MLRCKPRTDIEHESYQLYREQIIYRVREYGFVEISEILNFLKYICHSRLDDSDYLYIRSKLGKCLDINDDHSEYFIPLRELATELDCLVHYWK